MVLREFFPGLPGNFASILVSVAKIDFIAPNISTTTLLVGLLLIHQVFALYLYTYVG